MVYAFSRARTIRAAAIAKLRLKQFQLQLMWLAEKCDTAHPAYHAISILLEISLKEDSLPNRSPSLYNYSCIAAQA